MYLEIMDLGFVKTAGSALKKGGWHVRHYLCVSINHGLIDVVEILTDSIINYQKFMNFLPNLKFRILNGMCTNMSS